MTSPDEPQRPEPAESADRPENAPAEQTTAQQPPAQPPYPYPFAPVPRPPRLPWIAPQRKAAVIAISIVAACALLGAGVGIGAAAFGNDNHRPVQRFQRPGPYDRQGQYPGYPHLPNGPRRLPQSPTSPAPSASTTS